jgi:hypothetical protein
MHYILFQKTNIYFGHYVYRQYDTYLKDNGWIYDASRGLSVETKNPQKARSISGAPPKEIVDMSGIAHGARMDNGKSMRHRRKVNDLDKNDSVVDKSASVTPKAPRKASTPAPEWTPKLIEKLKISVKKQENVTKNGGVAWKKVVGEMGISNYHCKTQWTILQEAENDDSSSSSSEDADDDNEDKSDHSTRNTFLSMQLEFKREMAREMADMKSKLQKEFASKEKETAKLLAKAEEKEKEMVKFISKAAVAPEEEEMEVDDDKENKRRKNKGQKKDVKPLKKKKKQRRTRAGKHNSDSDTELESASESSSESEGEEVVVAQKGKNKRSWRKRSRIN